MWGRDDIVDKLIANNAARPVPGMDKPDAAVLAIPGGVPKTRATPTALAADPKQDTPKEPAQ